jgi:uncharacterized protein YpiB (UPF0302 family)
MYYPKGSNYIYNSEEFVKECLGLPSNPVVLAITHGYGQIEVEFVPSTMHLTGHVYSFMNDEKEMVIQLDFKDVANENTSALVLSSALYSYISEAYKMSHILNKILIQSTTYAK